MPLSLHEKLGFIPRRSLPPWYKSKLYLLNNVAPSLHHDYAAQRYYNSVDGETAFPFTATRTTNAMQFDSAGRLVWAPANMFTQSRDLNKTSPGWTKGSVVAPLTSGVQSHDGSLTAYKMVEASTTAMHYIQHYTAVTAPANSPNCVSVYVKAAERGYNYIQVNDGSSSNAMWCSFNLNTGTVHQTPVSLTGSFSNTEATITSVGNGWYRTTFKFTLNAVANFNVYLGLSADGTRAAYLGDDVSGIYITDPQAEMQDATSPKAFNVSTTSAYYGPRFDYDPATGQALGLLVEDARTNLVPTSFNLTTATMSNLATTSANSPATYLGGWSAVRFTADGTNNAHGAYPTSLVPTASSTVNLQAIIKPISANTFYQLTSSGNWLLDLNGYANFNLTGNGSITATGSSASNAFIRHLGGGVYHIGVSVSTSAALASGAACIVGVITTGTDTRLPANTSTDVFDFIYGAVFQSASGWCSVVPTFGTTATRALDTISIATGAWLDATKGTMYVDLIRGFVSTGSGNACAMARLYSDTNNYISFLSGSGTHSQHRVDTVVAGAAQAQVQTSLGGTQMTRRKMAGSYIANLFKGAENGSSGTDDTLGTIPTITTLSIGSAGISNTAIAGWVREFRYYRAADATSTQLQDLTT